MTQCEEVENGVQKVMRCGLWRWHVRWKMPLWGRAEGYIFPRWERSRCQKRYGKMVQDSVGERRYEVDQVKKE